MKHFYVFMMALVASLFLGVVSVSAATKEEVDYGVMELNKEYEMTSGNNFFGTFTPEKDGYLQVYTSGSDVLRPFKEWKGTAKETMALANNEYSHIKLKAKTGYSLNDYELPVKAGTTYYMCGSNSSGTTVKVTLKMEPKVIEYFGYSTKEGDDEVSPTSNNTVTFSFNRAITASAFIVYGDNKEESVTATFSSWSNSAVANLKEGLLKLVTAGSIQEGDDLFIVLRNIKENANDAGDAEPLVYDGEIKVKVKMGKAPAMLQGATLDGVPVTADTKFLTYYAPGTGKLVLTFSKALDPTSGNAYFSFGSFDDKDNGGYYREDNDDASVANAFKMKVEGNQVILDFSGKRRAVNDMVSSTESIRGADYTKINLQISNIKDTDGTRAFTTSSTTQGRFNYSLTLDVPETNVSCEFTPNNGASIKDQDEVEIWITDYETLSFQGVSFSYDQKANGIEPEEDPDGNIDIIKDVVVEMKDIKVEKDMDAIEDNAYILTVPIPAEVKNMNNVTVSLYKVTCADGVDYTDAIAAKYNVVTDGIENITWNGNKTAKVYNLNGQQVSKDAKNLHGIYVVDGKKVVLK